MLIFYLYNKSWDNCWEKMTCLAVFVSHKHVYVHILSFHKFYIIDSHVSYIYVYLHVWLSAEIENPRIEMFVEHIHCTNVCMNSVINACIVDIPCSSILTVITIYRVLVNPRSLEASNTLAYNYYFQDSTYFNSRLKYFAFCSFFQNPEVS